MRRVTAASVSAFAAALIVAVPRADADVLISVSKSQQRLAVTVDGSEIYRWPVSTGRHGLETPSGNFRPIRFERKWFSRKYDWSPMPFSIFFYKGYAVHGSYETKRLGHAASHGCVRLLPANAETLFDLVRKVGKNDTRIVVMNGPLPVLEPIVPPAPKLAPAPIPVPPPVKPKPAIDPAAGVAANDAPAVPRNDDEKALRAADDALMTKIKSDFASVARVPLPPLREAAPQTAIVLAAAKAEFKPRTERKAERHFADAGDEASVLRGREAWLRSLDRKYGITR